MAMRRAFLIALVLSLGAATASACGQGSESSVEWKHVSTISGHIVSPGTSTEQTATLVLDVDKNGSDDFIVAGRNGAPSVVWYRYAADQWMKYVIENAILPIEAGGAFYDIDGDGDLDIVFGGDSSSNKIWWWENPYPKFDLGVPWVRHEIKNTGANKHHDMIFGDFDGDGEAEFVFWNQEARGLFLAEIPRGESRYQPWPSFQIYSSVNELEGLAKADMDGDGKIDILGGGRWFKHMGGTTYSTNVIDDEMKLARVAVGQLKKGGRPEVVMVVGDGVGRLKWYEWSGSSWVGHDMVGVNVNNGHTLEVVDINGDGNLDVFCAEMRLDGGNPKSKMWAFFGDGNGRFTKTVVATGYDNHESKVADLNGDGKPDVLSKPYNWNTPRIDIWLNKGCPLRLDQWDRHVIDTGRPWRSIFIAAEDIDGDGKKDIVTGAWWYRNPGRSGAWTRNTIGSPLNNMAAVYDFDGDGHMDVLGTGGKGSDPNATFVWARNNGSGSFTVLRNIEKGEGDFLQGVAVGQFHKGGPLEVALSWHLEGMGVQVLTVSPDPSAGKWSWRRISTTSQDEALSAGDIDRDGDLDLLLGTKWLRNDGPSWTTFALSSSPGLPDRNRLVDINRDGRIDALVGYEHNKLAWYAQPPSVTSQWREHLIAKDIVRPMSLDVADMDGDGDLDIVVGEHNLEKPSNAKLYVLENLDGTGKRWKKHLVYTGDEHHDGAIVADIDGDGDLDIISIGWSHDKVILYENKANNATRKHGAVRR